MNRKQKYNRKQIKKLEQRLSKLEQQEKHHYLPPALKHLLAKKSFRYTLGFTVLFATVAIFAATITKPYTFSAGTKASAAEMNENFDRLYEKVNELSKNLGTYCGSTAATYNGSQVGGYTGAKAKCETACSSSTAHMCSLHEMSLTKQRSITTPNQNLWISSFMGGSANGNGQTDCAGWTVATTNEAAPYHTNSLQSPGWQFCNLSYALACCN